MDPARETPSGRLGTFAGVFTPSILTILGIILFLRLGYVVGAAGLGRALVMIGLANLISVLTSLSLATIATNLRVKKGGDYYLISRTLGVEYGGSLGLVLYLAQSVSIAFYAIGFGEAISQMIPGAPAWLPQVIAAVAVAGLFVLAWLGADAATRFQYVVMAVLFAALVAFFWGAAGKFDTATLRSNWGALEPSRPELSFWVIFAIFFPAVTGFTQGVSMSGDLRDPGRSLPLGTFLAVGLSILVYFGAAVMFAGAAPRDLLVGDYGVMRRLSLAGFLVDAGVIAATLSSALASYLGAPRILQSLAQDRVFPVLRPFAHGVGPSANPRRGVLLSTAIAGGTIALGNLNVIAPVVSMFFLISYGLLNYATYFEARSNSPSFRPTFRFYHPRVSLIGALACGGAMLAIQPVAAGVALAILAALHAYVVRTVGVERWADSGRSARLQRIRTDLLSLEKETPHPRDWRPVILAFSDDPGRRDRLLRFASWVEGGAGFITAVQVLEGRGATVRRAKRQAESDLDAEIRRLEVPAFGRVVHARDLGTALPVVLQAHGLGAIRANLVLVNWFDRPENVDTPGLKLFGNYLRVALRNECHVVVLSITTEEIAALEAIPARERHIDVWYTDDGDGRLMLLLAYLMTRSPEWRGARIRLLVDPGERTPEEARTASQAMLDEVRIPAEPVIVQPFDRPSALAASRHTPVVFVPFRLTAETPVGPFGGSLDDIAQALKIVVMCRAAQDIELDAEPESGVHATIAAALDTAERAAETAAKAEKAAEEAAEAAAAARDKLAAARREGDWGEAVPLENAAVRAVEQAEEARKRAAKARAKADLAQREAQDLVGGPPSPDVPTDPPPG